ncbi:MAG: S8 family serine peptidase, partial [Desulfobulbaceae bacterium]|nr:S8 family serine peptidase [Desulfobulbaceae bacterium]
MQFLIDRVLIILLSVSFLLSTPLAQTAYPKNIEFNDFVIDVTKGNAAVQGDEGKNNTKAKNKKWLVQFIGPILESEKKQLQELGCRIEDYLPEFTFIVSMDVETKEDVEELTFIKGVAKYRPEHKIRKILKEKTLAYQEHKGISKKADKKDIKKIHIRVDQGNHLPFLLSTVHKQKGKILDVSNDIATVEIPAGAISRIAELEEALWIEEAIDLYLFNDTSKWTIQTYVPDYTKIWDMGIRGEGQIIGIGDTGLDYDMPWFHDPENIPIGPEHRKVIGYTAYMDDYDGDFGHGTHVAGTIAGDRTPIDGLPDANGMAPKSRLFIQDITPGEQSLVYPPSDLGLLFKMPYSAGAHLHSNSWGASVNIYNTYARSTDLFMWEHKDFLALFSNGNSGDGEGTVGTPATSKNSVSVGATENGINAENLAGFSSNGPTADGRIKPTVTAPGVAIVSADSDGIKNSYNSGTIAYSGTSMATPTVAGAASLVRQYYLDGYWPIGLPNPADGFEPSAALIKATLINSAQNMSGDYTDGPIPSTGQGWGRINLSNTLHFFTDNNFLDIADIPAGLATGSNWTQRYFSTGDQFLKVTLVWTDYPGFEGAAKTLVNDLDLQVTSPDGTIYRGNVFNDGISLPGGSADELNVVEQVFMPTVQAG